MDQLYTNMKTKQVKANSFAAQSLSLEELLKADPHLISSTQVIDAFVQELKELLAIENLSKLIEKIFSLQTVLGKLTQHVPSDITVPNLDEFYKLLSPILMRSLQEHMLDQNSQILMDSWKNAICIAIEEELYLHKNSDH
jgi:hemoglobin-like flavoprotein